MKKLILIIILISSGLMATAQIYYDPGESIDINITVKEPFKPINYAEIGQDFTNAMQKEVARRNALKIYYDDIAYETKNSVYSNSILTNDYLIDNIIFKLQKKINDYIDVYQRLLKAGAMKPRDYENGLREIYSMFTQANREIAYLSRLKMYKLSSLKTVEEKNNFNKNFDKLLNNLDLSIGEYEVRFKLNNSEIQPINNLTNFISKKIDDIIDSNTQANSEDMLEIKIKQNQLESLRKLYDSEIEILTKEFERRIKQYEVESETQTAEVNAKRAEEVKRMKANINAYKQESFFIDFFPISVSLDAFEDLQKKQEELLKSH